MRQDPAFARRIAQACDDRKLRRLLKPLSHRIASLRTRPGFRRRC